MEENKTKAQGAKKQGDRKIEDVVSAGHQSMEKAAKAGRETAKKATRAGKNNAEKAAKAAKAGADAMSGGYDRYLALSKEQLEKVLPETVGRFSDFASFNKDTVDALVAASDVAAKAFETISDDVAAYNRQAWDDSIANTKALFGCKTFEDVVELQTTAVRTQFEKFLTDSAKLGELSLKAANEALDPISDRVNEAIDKFGKPVAA